jgi:hypothetical protein
LRKSYEKAHGGRIRPWRLFDHDADCKRTRNDPYFYGPYGLYGPYDLYPPVYSNKGEIQLKTNVKDADVYINGAFAGKAGKLKSIWLNPDAYSIEVRTPGAAPYSQRIYVVPGKTIKVEAYFPTAHK